MRIGAYQFDVTANIENNYIPVLLTMTCCDFVRLRELASYILLHYS